MHQDNQDYTALIQVIREMVLNGRLKKGDRLPAERKLCETLGVSRATLRRALQALAERKIIESRQGAGTYLMVDQKGFAAVDAVVDLIHNQNGMLQHILEFRQLIEPQIAALAAKRITPSDLKRLESITERQQQALEDGDDTASMDIEFHSALVTITANPVIAQVMESISSVIDTTRSSCLQNRERALCSHSGHTRILEALRNQDADGAFQAMQKHIRQIEGLIEGPSQEEP